MILYTFQTPSFQATVREISGIFEVFIDNMVIASCTDYNEALSFINSL